jgi:hypothetical protein
MYFRLVKFVAWLAFGAALAAAPNMILFQAGGRYGDWQGIGDRPFGVGTIVDAKRSLAVFSLGNLPRPDNETLYDIPFVHVEVGARHFSMTVTAMMGITAVIIALGVLWLWVAESAMAARTSWNKYGTVTMEDYSVAITGVPDVVSRADLKKHIETVWAHTRACSLLSLHAALPITPEESR